jgi:hypothetical protein
MLRAAVSSTFTPTWRIAGRSEAQRSSRPVVPIVIPRRCVPSRFGTTTRAADDDEFAVFRFTLGIPGFDDQDIPRVVGLLGASLLVANHLSGANPSEAQARTELIGGVLAAACVVVPALGRRLDETGAVEGGTLDVAGGEQVFALAPSLAADADAAADAAWSTYALLTQTNAQGAFLWVDGSGVTCARGSVRLPTTGMAPPGAAESTLAALTASAKDAKGLRDEIEPVYLRDRSAIDRAGANTWGFLPPGVESVLVQPARLVNGKQRLILMSSRPRAFNAKQRAWAAAIANKLAAKNE